MELEDISGAGRLGNGKASDSPSPQNPGFLLAVEGPCGDWVPDADSPCPSHPRLKDPENTGYPLITKNKGAPRMGIGASRE